MAVTQFQSDVLRLLARRRKSGGERYVAGGLALNQLLGAPRLSRDINLFHDTQIALAESWRHDRNDLEGAGYRVEVFRERLSFVEAEVSREGQKVEVQWTRDSAFRFFPLIEDDLLGLSLHPFDLATNKVLAMAGRLEPRDWVDTLTCASAAQPLGYLVWAACGKDPGFNPTSLLAEISRFHYSQAELDTLDYETERPDARVLGAKWHQELASTREVGRMLPPEEVGTCVYVKDAGLCQADASTLETLLAAGLIGFHAGSIGGSWPQMKS